jgi:hypothetical protein
MLFLRKQYFDAIREGKKTTTLRFWRHAMVRPDTIHTVRGLGRLRILAVERIWPDGLTDADALADGFGDLPALRKALTAHYPAHARHGKQLYRVRFQFLADGK